MHCHHLALYWSFKLGSAFLFKTALANQGSSVFTYEFCEFFSNSMKNIIGIFDGDYIKPVDYF